MLFGSYYLFLRVHLNASNEGESVRGGKDYVDPLLMCLPLKLRGPVDMKKKRKKLTGRVEKIIQPLSGKKEKAQMGIDEGEDLYREIRVENELTDESGKKARLKPGAEVDVIVEADSNGTTQKPD